MRFKFPMLFAALAAAFLSMGEANAVTGSTYPSLVLQNQYGETYINKVKGGTGWMDCQFVVAAADAAGKGITGLSGAPCASVYMHTSATPSAANPNPNNGTILVNLSSQLYQYLNGYAQFQAPLGSLNIGVSTSGSSIGTPYIIQSVGTTSQVGWQTLGLPTGIVAAASVAFIATATITVPGTGLMDTAATSGSGISLVDLVGDPSLTNALSNPQIILRTLAATSSSVTTLIPTAPAAGTIIKLHFIALPLSGQLH